MNARYQGCRITRAQLFVEFEQSLVLSFNWITIQCGLDITDCLISINTCKRIEQTLIGRKI